MLRTRTTIVITLVVSLLIHLILIFVPWVKLPPVEVELPPMTAKLVTLPKVTPPAAKPAKPKPPKPPKPKFTKPPIASDEPIPMAASEVASSVAAASSVEATSAVAAVSSVEVVSAVEPVAVIAAVSAVPASHPALPKHAQLHFLVYKGKNFQVGEAKHRLEISDDQHYSIKVGMSTTGIVSLFKIYDSEQISNGTIDAQGLHPDNFVENRRTGKGLETFAVQFDWADKLLHFSAGNQVALPEHTQDLLSALYQVSQLAIEKGSITVPYTNGRKLEYIEFTVGEEQALPTRIGTLRALPLRKVHAVGEEGLEIWLGLEYRLLPIKFTQIDRAGAVQAEMVISEIRVKD